jgi:3-oxoadipate enol-lactonase
MNTATTNGIRLRYEVQGQGPWLILCHSLATDLSLWDEQLPALIGRFRVLRFDTRGHGGSEAPAGAYDFPMLTADVLGLMDALGVDKAHFVGISLGGMIGQHLALAAPGRLDRLVLVSTTSGYPPEAAALWAERNRTVAADGLEPLVAPTLERWFTPAYRAAQSAVMDRIAGLIRATPPAGYMGCGAAIATLAVAPLTARLGAIACPTLVVAGADDAGTPPAMGRTIAERIPGARFESLASASHLCNVEQAEAFNRLLLGFLG